MSFACYADHVLAYAKKCDLLLPRWVSRFGDEHSVSVRRVYIQLLNDKKVTHVRAGWLSEPMVVYYH